MSVDLHILTYFWRAWHSKDVGKQTDNVSRVGFPKNNQSQIGLKNLTDPDGHTVMADLVKKPEKVSS